MEVWDSPCSNLMPRRQKICVDWSWSWSARSSRSTSIPRQRRQKMCLIRVNHTSVGGPQEEGMMSVVASFPQFWNQGYRTSRNWERRSCQLRLVDVEPAHNTMKIFCPNETVRLSISPACWKQKIRCIVWKMIVTCRKMQRVMIAVDLYSDVKDWTGVHSSLVVSLHDKWLTCWVNKL